MKKKLQMMTMSLLLMFGLVGALTFASPVSAQCDGTSSAIADGLCSGAERTDPDADSTETASDRVNNIISTVINVFSIVVGVVSVVMIIIGGLKYITSGGDSGNVTGAKNTILYAIIGLVVVALAQVIVRFVLEKALTTG